MRPLSYPMTDVFLLCYSIENRCSFDNIESKWILELRHFCPDIPVMLVGCKIGKFSRLSINLSQIIIFFLNLHGPNSKKIFAVLSNSRLLNVEKKFHGPPSLITYYIQFWNIFVYFSDLRSTSSRSEEFVTTEEGKAMAKKLGASFCETSSLHLIGLQECFSAAVGPFSIL